MFLRSLLQSVTLALCLASVVSTRPGEKQHEKLIGYLGEVHSVENATKKPDAAPLHESIQTRQFIMDRRHRPKPSHHASTIVEVEGGALVAAWFAGRFEGKPDVGIFVSRLDSYESTGHRLWRLSSH